MKATTLKTTLVRKAGENKSFIFPEMKRNGSILSGNPISLECFK